MKAKFIVLILCLLIAGMPIINAISAPKVLKNNKGISLVEKIKLNDGDIPFGAEGELNGTWGLREHVLFGMVEIPIGNFTGYYTKIMGFIYSFTGVIYPFGDKTKPTNISALFFGSFIIGFLDKINISQENQYNINTNITYFVGIGEQNESSFDWRIMGYTGPTFFLKGNFLEFE